MASFFFGVPRALAFFDSDGDTWADAFENYLGTDKYKACGQNAWPPDINSDSKVDTADVDLFKAHFLTKSGDAAFNKRFDLNGDGQIGIGDVGKLIPYFC